MRDRPAMKRNKNKKHDALIFAGTLVIILLILKRSKGARENSSIRRSLM